MVGWSVVCVCCGLRLFPSLPIATFCISVRVRNLLYYYYPHLFCKCCFLSFPLAHLPFVGAHCAANREASVSAKECRGSTDHFWANLVPMVAHQYGQIRDDSSLLASLWEIRHVPCVHLFDKTALYLDSPWREVLPSFRRGGEDDKVKSHASFWLLPLRQATRQKTASSSTITPRRACIPRSTRRQPSRQRTSHPFPTERPERYPRPLLQRCIHPPCGKVPNGARLRDRNKRHGRSIPGSPLSC